MFDAPPVHLRADDPREFVWATYVQAGPLTSSWQPHTPADVPKLKELIYKPFARLESVMAICATMRRWRHWAYDKKFSLTLHFQPSPLVFASFMDEASLGGPTAAATVYKNMGPWVERLGFQFPLHHPLVRDFKYSRDGHTPSQAQELTPAEFWNLMADADTTHGSTGFFINLGVLSALACIRWTHIQRSTVTSLELEGCAPTWWCTQGKRKVKGIRPGYRWFLPLPLAPGIGGVCSNLTGSSKVALPRSQHSSLFCASEACSAGSACRHGLASPE